MPKIPFKLILDQTDDIVIVTEATCIDKPHSPKILYVNEAFIKLTGYSLKEVIGQTPRILQGEKTDLNTLKKIREALEKKESIHVELLNYTKDQREFWLVFTIMPIKNNKGQIKYFAAIEHDITERKKMEEMHATLSSLVEFSGEAFIGNDLEGTIRSWNKAAENLYGYSQQEAIGKNIQMLIPDECRKDFQMIIQKIKKNEQIKDFETVRRHKDGHIIRVSLTISPIKNSQGDIIGASVTAHDITQRKLFEEKLKHIAEHDNLTGLVNRPLFVDGLIQALAFAKREKCMVAICFLDIDNFKIINDTCGHHIGDLLLCAVAQRIQENIREIDTLARWGGDEMALLLPYLKKKNDAEIVVKKLLRLLDESFVIEDHNLNVSMSIGVALYPKDGSQDLIKKADAAMYYIKKNSKNNFIFYNESVVGSIKKGKSGKKSTL